MVAQRGDGSSASFQQIAINQENLSSPMCFFSSLIKFSGSSILDPSGYEPRSHLAHSSALCRLSVLWVAAASYIISFTLDDPVLRSRAYLANELILVAISTALFYILLKIGKDTPSAPVIHPLRPARPGKRLLMLSRSRWSHPW